MRLLKEKNVLVIVPALKEGQQHKHYDMNNRDHRRAFRVEMEKAGSYIPEQNVVLDRVFCAAQKPSTRHQRGFWFRSAISQTCDNAG